MKEDKNNFRPIVGIDLGTTNSAVARITKGDAHIITSAAGDKLIPSVVHVNQKGEIIVGKDAASALVAMPERTVAEVKRDMGSKAPISIADKELLPEEISSLILQELKKYAERIYGEETEIEAVITVPAYFTDEQRRATKKAGELAGFVVERIINEPTAAAMAYGLDNLDQDSHILVYDLGGGTFDVSLVEMMSGVLEVKSSTGNKQLGGTDFDWELVNLFAEKVIDDIGIDPRDDLQACALLKDEAEKAKIALSDNKVIDVSIPGVIVKENQPYNLNIKLDRKEFEKLIEDRLQETIASIKSVLRDADLGTEDIDEILLVGGSTRIPRVVELVTDFFGKEPRKDINPEQVVALGAAIQAGIKSGILDDSGMIVTDVAPYSMGIEVLKGWIGMLPREGGFAPIITRNTTIPTTRTETFYTSYDNQTEASINIFQGEGDWVKENHPLGEFILSGIPENGAGKEEIEVTFSYNLNGILEVTAKCVSTGEQMSVTVQDTLERDSEEAYKESKQRLEKFLEEAASEAEADQEEELEQMEEYFENLEDEVIDVEEPVTFASLREEAEGLIERAKHLIEEKGKNVRLKAEHVIVNLEEAIGSEDMETLEEAVDEAADKLINLEVGGD